MLLLFLTKHETRTWYTKMKLSIKRTQQKGKKRENGFGTTTDISYESLIFFCAYTHIHAYVCALIIIFVYVSLVNRQFTPHIFFSSSFFFFSVFMCIMCLCYTDWIRIYIWCRGRRAVCKSFCTKWNIYIFHFHLWLLYFISVCVCDVSFLRIWSQCKWCTINVTINC